jgi:hypothetical protein
VSVPALDHSWRSESVARIARGPYSRERVTIDSDGKQQTRHYVFVRGWHPETPLADGLRRTVDPVRARG